MIIKRAEYEDLEQILELQCIAYQSEAKLMNDFTIPPLMQTIEDTRREFSGGVFLKAVGDEDEIIGSVRAYIKEDTAYIGKLIVRPDLQGQGIGTMLLSAIERECPAERYELFTSGKSVRNIRLYERLGYKRFREQEISDGLTFVYLKKQLIYNKPVPKP